MTNKFLIIIRNLFVVPKSICIIFILPFFFMSCDVHSTSTPANTTLIEGNQRQQLLLTINKKHYKLSRHTKHIAFQCISAFYNSLPSKVNNSEIAAIVDSTTFDGVWKLGKPPVAILKIDSQIPPGKSARKVVDIARGVEKAINGSFMTTEMLFNGVFSSNDIGTVNIYKTNSGYVAVIKGGQGRDEAHRYFNRSLHLTKEDVFIAGSKLGTLKYYGTEVDGLYRIYRVESKGTTMTQEVSVDVEFKKVNGTQVPYLFKSQPTGVTNESSLAFTTFFLEDIKLY